MLDTFDSNFSFESHVSSICITAFFHFKNISKLQPMLSMSNAEMLIYAFMTSSLDLNLSLNLTIANFFIYDFKIDFFYQNRY